MEAVFHFQNYLDSTRVDLPILERKFCLFPGISLLVELEAWAELGKKNDLTYITMASNVVA